ncbi:MAG: hypothetical protein QOF41_1104 [Methylobacteriaceae bacterium]|nr:hypothetical protein [Methylobacteriaceae bacterium]
MAGIEKVMNNAHLLRRAKSIFYVVGINVAVFAVLFLVFELAVHMIWPEENPWLSPPFAKSKVRLADPIYGHTLKANYAGEEDWGDKTKLMTNSLGFKDSATRDVPLRSDRKRVLFLGDSFTEGLGTAYEQTFVGRFASAYPQLDVLNAAVSSYAPSIYFAKAKYLLDMGLQVDEMIVYIDISDIQDEAIFYRFDENGHIKEGNFDENCRAPEMIFSATPKWGYWSYTLDFFYKRYLLSKISRDIRGADVSALIKPGQSYGPDRARASWTYDPKSACYGTMGIDGGIAKAIAQMNRLYALASERNIPLSVGVYPWPQQMLYDTEASRQVTIWRDWCKDKCRRFFNHFPAMFAYKREHQTFLRDLLIWGDVHYNAFGNELIARNLIAQYP